MEAAEAAAAATPQQRQKKGPLPADLEVVQQPLSEDSDEALVAELQQPETGQQQKQQQHQKQKQREMRRALSLPSGLKVSPAGFPGLLGRSGCSPSSAYKTFGPVHFQLLQQVNPKP